MKARDAEPCTDFEKSVTQKGNSLSHQKIHTVANLFSCTYCAKSFNRKAYLTNHQRIHKGGKIFSGDKQEKRSLQKVKRVLHPKIHTEDRAFACEKCEKSFRVKANLIKHQIIHTQEASLPCTDCGKRFFLKEHLQKHQKIHTGERPFLCSQCKKSFTRKDHLLRHQIIHTGERPFVCSQCEKRFVQKGHLKKHQGTHKESTLTTLTQGHYSCTDCEKSFSGHENLIMHQKIHTCPHELGDSKPERERSAPGSSPLGETASTAQEENGKEKEFQFSLKTEVNHEDLKLEGGVTCDRKKKGHSAWGSISTEMQAETNLSKHTQKEILEVPTVSSRTAILKAATFTFNSSVTVPPPTAPAPTFLVTETTKAPFRRPAFYSFSPPSVPPVLPQPEFDTKLGMLKTCLLGTQAGKQFTCAPNENFPK